MTRGTFYSNDLKCMVQQVTKPTARKMYESGKIVYFQPSNMRFDNMWLHPMPAQKNSFSFAGYTFDEVCSSFQTYNCDNERGRYIHFFVCK